MHQFDASFSESDASFSESDASFLKMMHHFTNGCIIFKSDASN
jgi:hypothetical protein